MIGAFVDGATRAFGPSVHAQGDALYLGGWWHAAFRVAPEVFIVCNEEPPEPSPVLDLLAAALADHGLREVGVDLPLIQPITYTQLSLGHMSWALWARDLAAGEAALVERATAETFLTDAPVGGLTGVGDLDHVVDVSAGVGGLRRIAGLPASLVLAVGLEPSQVDELRAALGDCRVEARSFEEMPAAGCPALLPALVVVDATGPTGRAFVAELRADAGGRVLPVAAVAAGGEVPAGADVALDGRGPAATWAESLRNLLP